MSHPDPLYDPTDVIQDVVQMTPRFINLRERREALHITQAEMAQILEVSRLTYINYEKDIMKIPLGKYLTAENLIIGLETTRRNLMQEAGLSNE